MDVLPAFISPHLGTTRFARVRALLLGSALGIALGLGLGPAFASVVSGHKNFTTNTVSYENWAQGDDGLFGRGAGTRLDRNSHGTASAGKMGGRARLYFSGGTLCKSGATFYNTESTTAFHTFIRNDEPPGCGGYLFSKGFTHTWDGTGYEQIATERTPNWLE